MLAVCCAAIGLIGLLFWSTASVDRMSRERQHRLAEKVLAQSEDRIAHEQESVTVWDDSIHQLRRPTLDLEWHDNNLGVWLHEFYGHDAAYVLNPADRPVYGMVAGERRPPADFERVRAAVMPLIAELRRTPPDKIAPDQLSPGVTELLVMDGRPTIVSLKPIVTDTGRIVQEPGTEFVHIVVRHLDGSFVHELRDDYGLDGARIATSVALRPGDDVHPLTARNGRAIGYFAWRPFQPGSAVFARLAPVLAAASILVALLVFLLMRRIATHARALRESTAAVQHLAFHDVLTGLPNRALFEDRLEHALQIFQRTPERRLALLFLDLDRFKSVNDTLGHAAGDALIREFARRLSKSVRAGDTAARLGGDEFAVIQSDISTIGDVETLCEKIVAAASEPFVIEGARIHVGVSVGVALAGTDGLVAEELARKADIALYEVKANGRGKYRLFSPAMDEPIRARQAVESDLRRAIESGDQFSVVYQPTYSATDGAIVGVEALMRWRHPENGMVPPAIFIPVAEEIGLIEPLGHWVIAQACRDARDWPVATISINVSPVQLRNPHFATRAMTIIGESGIEPERVEFEITETAVIEDTPQCSANLRLLREFGVRIALDDFGTGHSSFSHFNEFEVDRLKIDRTFVDRIDVKQDGSAIIQAMVDLARSSGFKTTAEGVETLEQKAFLQRIGCDDLQGFLMASPIPAREIDALLGRAEPSWRLRKAAV